MQLLPLLFAFAVGAALWRDQAATSPEPPPFPPAGPASAVFYAHKLMGNRVAVPVAVHGLQLQPEDAELLVYEAARKGMVREAFLYLASSGVSPEMLAQSGDMYRYRTLFGESVIGLFPPSWQRVIEEH